MSKIHLSSPLGRLALWANRFSERYKKAYLFVAVLFMLIGYAFLLLFPLLVIEGSAALFREIPNAKTTEHWIAVEIWAAILLFCLYLSRQIFCLRFPRVSGLKLSKDLAPDLYSLIAGMRKYNSKPSIRNVVLTDQYELRIEEAPRLGYPFSMSNTLVIGMPMLQTLTEEQFQGELLRRLNQYASGRFRPSHWLFRARLLWKRYADALESRKRFGEAPMRWFFSFYSPMFEMLTLPAARMDELVADSAVLEWLNDRDYFETVKSSVIAEIFLAAHYWRKVHQLALKNPKLPLNPFEELEHISGHLKSKEFRKKWLQGAYAAEQNVLKTMPAFRQRMEGIAQEKIRQVPVVEKTAAESCLGEARKDFISIIDKLWRSTTFRKWKLDYEKRRTDISRVKKLSRRSQTQVLKFREMMLYARLAKQLRGDPLRRSILKVLKRNVSHLLPSLPGWDLLQRKMKASRDAEDVIT